MKFSKFPITVPNWNDIELIVRDGVTGKAASRIFFMDDIRVRQVEYSPGFLADHWCHKGHIIYCVEGSLEATLEDGTVLQFGQGSTCHIGDDGQAHRFSSVNGCRLLIID